MRKWIEDNIADILVGLFIVLIVFGFWQEANAETNVEFGPTAIGGNPSDGYMLLLNETFDDKWRIGMGLFSDQTYKDQQTGTTLYVHGQRLVRIKGKFSLGLGVAYLNNKRVANGSGFNSSLSVEYALTRRIDIRWRHFSNAGSVRPNPGHDILTVSYTFR